MSDALKPCPFCGERPQLTVRPDNADATTYFAAVVCYCDSYSACAHKMATAPEADEAEAAARAAWNRRAALSAPPPVVPAEPSVPFASVGDLIGPGMAAMVGAKVTDGLYTWGQVLKALAAAPQAPTHPGQAPTGGAE